MGIKYKGLPHSGAPRTAGDRHAGRQSGRWLNTLLRRT
jgi:HKD family nuclease